MSWANQLAATIADRFAPIDWSLPAAARTHLDPPPAPPDEVAPVRARLDPADDYVPWPTRTPTGWRPATGRWVTEIEEAHTAHLQAVAGLPDGGGVLGDAGTDSYEVAEADWVVPGEQPL